MHISDDILRMIDAVADMISGSDFAAFESDVRPHMAVERGSEIVSKASRRIPATNKERFGEVPWSNIAAIGNVLRHEYHRIAPALIWHAASRSLPDLRPVIVSLLDQGDERA